MGLKNTPKDVYLIDAAGTSITIPTVGGLTFTAPFRSVEKHYETGDIRDIKGGEKQFGTASFNMFREDFEKASGLAVWEILRWKSTAVRAAWTPTNNVSASCVDDHRGVPEFTLKQTASDCTTSEDLELYECHLSAAPGNAPNANGAAEQVTFSFEYRSMNR